MKNFSVQPGTPFVFESDDALNFRELGGYRAADGRTVKHGVFFRGPSSGVLDSDADREQFDSFGLATILDLRSYAETKKLPDYVPEGCDYLRIGGMHFPDGSELDFSPEAIGKMMEMGKELGSELAVFTALYKLMPFGNPAFQELFRRLESHQTPLFFHCTAGKDRTGIAGILILLALGVDKETALNDYELTNRCRAPFIERELAAQAEEVAKNPALAEKIKTREGVSRAMAVTTINEIEARYPSYEAYFEAEYGLTPARLKALRDAYLE